MKYLAVISIGLCVWACTYSHSTVGFDYIDNKSLSGIIDSLKIDRNKIFLVIEKSNYKLKVMSADSAVLKSYPVVFGKNPVDDKLQQGDGCTPEGWFIIKSKYPHKSWNKFMWLDYPNKNSWQKYNAAVAQKKITAGTDIGGEVGIHGVPKNTDYMIDKKINWTLGCISLRNADVDEVYNIAKQGTKVYIKK